MKRGFAWLLTLLTLLGLLSGCGGGGDTTAPDTASNSAATEEADDAAPTVPGQRRKWLRTPAVRRRTVPPTVWRTPR